MPNEEYQRLLRSDAGRAARAAARRGPRAPRARRALIADLDDADAARARSATSAATTSPTCSTAFARGGRRRATGRRSSSPTRSRRGGCRRRAIPANHSALLSAPQWRAARRRARAPTPSDPWARVRPGVAGGRSCARRAATRLERAAGRATPRRRRCRPTSGASHAGARVDPAGVRAVLRRPRPRRARGRRARRHGQPDVASSTNLGGWINRVGIWHARRPDRLVRRRHRHARALARVRARPAHRARDRRGQPRRAARRARRDLVARRAAAAADRHALRPVRQPRARAVVVRDLRRRPVDPGRHARRASRSRPRAARTSRSSPRRSGSSSRAASPGSRRSARTSSGRCCTRSARLGRADGASAYLRLSTRPIDQSLAAVPADPAAREPRRRTALAGGYRLRCAASAPRGHARRRWASSCPRCSPPPTSSPTRGSAVDVVCLTSADLVFRALQARARACATAIDDRSSTTLFPPSAPAPDRHRARRPPAHAVVPRRRQRHADQLPRRPATSASRATSRTSTATSASTPRRSSAPRST